MNILLLVEKIKDCSDSKRFNQNFALRFLRECCGKKGWSPMCFLLTVVIINEYITHYMKHQSWTKFK